MRHFTLSWPTITNTADEYDVTGDEYNITYKYYYTTDEYITADEYRSIDFMIITVKTI